MQQPYVTAAQMLALAPAANQNLVTQLAPALCREMERCQINTPLRVKHFMAEIAVESGGFRSLEEDLNYSAERLMVVWPHRFEDVEVAAQYAHQPQKLANFVYGGRMGNTLPDSGWRYRGRSLLMITGYDAYVQVQQITGLPLVHDPDLASMAEHAARIAADWWRVHGLNAFADADNTAEERHRINGGEIGLQLDVNYVAKGATIWAAEAA